MASTFSSGSKKKTTKRPATLSQILASQFSTPPKGQAAQQAFYATATKYRPILDALLAQRAANVQQYERGRQGNAFSAQAASQGIGRIASDFAGSAPVLSADAGPEQRAIHASMGLSREATQGILARQAAAAAEAPVVQNEALRNKYLSDQDQVTQQALSTLQQSGDYFGVQRGVAAKDLRNYRVAAQNAETAAQRAKVSAEQGDRRLDVSEYAAQTGRINAMKPSSSKVPKPRSGPGSASPKDERRIVGDIERVARLIQTADYTKFTPQQVLQSLATGENPYKKPFDTSVINAGRSLAKNKGKGLGKWGVKNAHRAGIHVGGNFKIIR